MSIHEIIQVFQPNDNETAAEGPCVGKFDTVTNHQDQVGLDSNAGKPVITSDEFGYPVIMGERALIPNVADEVSRLRKEYIDNMNA